MHATTRVFTSIGDAVEPTCKDEIKVITLTLIKKGLENLKASQRSYS
jgi:hypothetical protein